MKQMETSQLTDSELKTIAKISHRGVAAHSWITTDQIDLTEEEHAQIEAINNRLMRVKTSLLNEATLWARAIYPLLALAEQDNIQAWSQVYLYAQYPHFELQGIADGVLGSGIGGMVEVPYFIVVEAKRSIEAQDPRFALYGQLLAAAHMNWKHDQQPIQDLYGCYTIGDNWTFVKAQVTDIETDVPALMLELSREYVQRMESPTILKLLKHIIRSRFSSPLG